MDFSSAKKTAVTVEVLGHFVEIGFAKMPDTDVLLSLEKEITLNPGFLLRKLNDTRFMVSVPRSYDSTIVGKIIAKHLRGEHGLPVSLYLSVSQSEESEF